MIVKLLNARVQQYGILQTLPGPFHLWRPMLCDGFSIFLFTYGVQWSRTHLEIRNELGVELGKADEFCYLSEEFWRWPCLQKTVFGLCRMVSILAYVNANKFKACREK
jgi:hypothetical protein